MSVHCNMNTFGIDKTRATYISNTSNVNNHYYIQIKHIQRISQIVETFGIYIYNITV